MKTKEFFENEQAALAGNADAQCSLGCIYDFGLEGVDKNYQEAVNWYRKAADQGHKSGQYFLGTCYQLGKYVNKNNEEAAKWYRKAVSQGHAKAKEALDLLINEGLISTAPSSTSSYTPPPSSATSKPAAPVAPKPAPAPVSNVWQLKAPAYGSVFRQYKYYGEYVKKGQDVLEFCKESGGDVNLKSEVDGYITNELKSNLNVNAGTVLIEITPGKKKGLFG